MIGAVIGLVIAGVVALMLFGIVFSVVFGAIALAFKVIPLLLAGWIVVKVVQRLERPRPYAALSTADQRWLDR